MTTRAPSARLILTVVLAALASLAVAQSPYATATRVFDRVVAAEVPCNATTLTHDFTAAYDRAFCGYIRDAMTDVNTRWTTEEFLADGYGNYVSWVRDATMFPDGVVWMVPYTRPDWDAFAVLLVGDDATVILLTFDRR